jgi:MFS family permease
MDQYLTLLRVNSNYRNLWLGNVVSLLGDWFNLIATATLVANLTSSGVALSYLFLSRLLPQFFFSPVAGVLADRFSRRTILIVSDLSRALIVLGFLVVRRPDQVWFLYLLLVIQFAMSAMFNPARSAVLANVVSRKDLVTANALDSVTWSTMLAFGAMLGGIVAALFGRDVAFVMDAGTYLLSAYFVSRIRIEGKQDFAIQQGGSWLNFMDGLRYLWGAPFILIISMMKGVGSLTWGALNVVEVSYAETIFPILADGTLSLGLLYAVSGIGTGVGPLVLRRYFGDTPIRIRQAIILAFGLMVTGFFIISWAPTIETWLFGTLLRTIGTGTIWVFTAALLQLLVPDRFRGRVFAFEFAFLTLTQSISTFWAGWAQDSLGLDIRQIVMVSGVVSVFTGLLWVLFYFRTRYRIEPAPETSAAD